jgi:hypothetical protein
MTDLQQQIIKLCEGYSYSETMNDLVYSLAHTHVKTILKLSKIAEETWINRNNSPGAQQFFTNKVSQIRKMSMITEINIATEILIDQFKKRCTDIIENLPDNDNEVN